MSDRIAVMSAGRILQVGTPRDIYDHPTERFVADFIGDTNFLEAELLGMNGHAVLKLPSGATIAASTPAAFEGSGTVCVAVRPEQAKLSRNPAAVNGVLENVVYFGTDTLFHVRTDEGGRFVVRQQNSRGDEAGFAPGDRVGVVIAEGAAQVLRG